MSKEVTETGKQAASGPVGSLLGLQGPVTGAAIAPVVARPKQGVQGPLITIQPNPPPAVTAADFERWLREAITAWQEASEDAVDRAIDVLEGAKNANMYSTLGSSLEIGGAVIAPIFPWAGGSVAILGTVLKDVVASSPLELSLEGFRTAILEATSRTNTAFLSDIPGLIKGLQFDVDPNPADADAARRWAYERVLGRSSIVTTSNGVTGIDRTRLRAEIEAAILMQFASSGERARGAGGGSYPFFIVIEEYDVTSERDENGDLRAPNLWSYVNRSVRTQTYALPKLKPRLRGLSRILGRPLDLSDLPVPLSLTFRSSVLGTAEYLTHTGLWQPPRQFEVELKSYVGEGQIIPPGGVRDMIKVVDAPTASTGLWVAVDGLIGSTRRYGGWSPLYSNQEQLGMVLAREAWQGPFPPIQV